MPIILRRHYDLKGEYETPQERDKLIEIIEEFRSFIMDYKPELNILDGKQLKYTDNDLLRYLKLGLDDLNSGYPPANYTMFNFPDETLVIQSSFVKLLIAEGILQLRNNVNYSDSGLSLDMFNKSGAYQTWAGFVLQQYMGDKKEFKTGLIPRSYNSGFIGLGSGFGYY